MAPDYACDPLKWHHSTHSMATMETDDVTNNTSTSSGASLDVDVHGLTRTNHLQSSQQGKGYTDFHVRAGDSYDGFGESFMMEESFAYGESFTCNDDGCNFLEQRHHVISRQDIASVVVIEEDDEETTQLEEDKGETHGRDLFDLERRAQSLTLKEQSLKVSFKR
jgi:hypothetical protein